MIGNIDAAARFFQIHGGMVGAHEPQYHDLIDCCQYSVDTKIIVALTTI